MNYMLIATGVLMCGLVVYTGSLEMDAWYYTTVMIVLAPIGYLLEILNH